MSKATTKLRRLLNTEGELTHDDLEMSNILADQYTNVFSNLKDNLPNIIQKNIPEPLEQMNLSTKELIEAINELSATASSGSDNFPAIFFKNCKIELVKPLSEL